MDSWEPEIPVDSRQPDVLVVFSRLPEVPVDSREPELPVPEVLVDAQDLEVVDSQEMEVPVEVEVPVDSRPQQEEV